MTKRKLFENVIWKLPFSAMIKLKMTRRINILFNTLSGKRNLNDNVALVNSNGYYGHEYWMKKYSNWNKPIGGLIEHGVYFGNNTNMVGDKRDYTLKSIITFGDYRSKIIKQAFPMHRVVEVGPRIAYSETDASLLQNLIKEANGEKVLTLFPAHSTANCKCEYDVDYLISKAKEVMDRKGIAILRVCMKEQDIMNGTADRFAEKGCAIVTAGSASIQFLPRLRAIIESSSITMSNSLGTHLGYCIFLGKPHILIQQDRTVSGDGEEYLRESDPNNPIEVAYRNEEKRFIEVFCEKDDLGISEEQYNLCDYYWGFKYFKQPSELYEVFEQIQVK